MSEETPPVDPADYETSRPGDPSLTFEDLGPPDRTCPSCGTREYVLEDSDEDEVFDHKDNRKIVTELRSIRHLLESIYWGPPHGLSKGMLEDLIAERRPSLWQRIKARWTAWRDGDERAGPTGNDRCRRDVWEGKGGNESPVRERTW